MKEIVDTVGDARQQAAAAQLAGALERVATLERQLAAVPAEGATPAAPDGRFFRLKDNPTAR